MTLAVVIVSWNVRDLLDRCLASLEAASDDLRTVVVDNRSGDGSADMVRSRYSSVDVVANDENVGFARANNQALRMLGVADMRDDAPETVLLLNPDTEVMPGAIPALQRHLDRHPDAGAVGPLLRNPDGSVQSSRRRFPGVAAGVLESTPLEWHWPGNPVARRYRMDDVPPTCAGRVDWVTGAAVLFRSRALADVGLLDERYFMYSEELDLFRRMLSIGWHVHFEPAAEVVHHEGKSSEQDEPSRHRRFQRSRVRYFRTHGGYLAAAVVRAGIAASFGAETALEAAKWAAGSRRSLRRARVSAYSGVVRDALIGD